MRRADRQEKVDAIVRRIRETLDAARNSPDWSRAPCASGQRWSASRK